MDSTFEILCRIYYSQKINYDFSPTYVEKKKLEMYISKIKKYRQGHLRKIQDIFDNYFDESKVSMIGWSIEYYESERKRVNDFIEIMEDKIKKCHNDRILIGYNELSQDEMNLKNELENSYSSYGVSDFIVSSKYKEEFEEIEKMA